MANQNVIEYLKWRGDISFKEDPLNEIDLVIFSQIVFFDFNNVTKNRHQYLSNALLSFYKDKLEKNDVNFGLIIPKEINHLAKIVKDSERYSKIKVSDFVNDADPETFKQFAAMTLHLDSQTMVVVFRGTDDSLAGWVEDFIMISEFPVESQLASREYLNRMHRQYPEKKIYVCGHSKGGNLAFYSTIYADDYTKEQIIKSYSIDGPGFTFDRLSNVRLKQVEKRLVHLVPNEAIVGRMLSNPTAPTIVKSIYNGINQHDVLSWQIKRNRFIKLDKFEEKSNRINDEVNTLIYSMNLQERDEFTKDFSSYVKSLEETNLLDFSNPMKFFDLLIAKHKIQMKTFKHLVDFMGIFSRNNAIIKTIKN